MIEFSNNKSIYRQIIDYAYLQILTGAWRPGERIPSVRELTASLGVNARTVLKAMDSLQASEMIISKRGMGFTLAADACTKVNAERRREFFSTTLPAFLSEMKILDIPAEDIIEAIKNQ